MHFGKTSSFKGLSKGLRQNLDQTEVYEPGFTNKLSGHTLRTKDNASRLWRLLKSFNFPKNGKFQCSEDMHAEFNLVTSRTSY